MRIRALVAAALLGVALLAPAAQLELPSVGDPAAPEHHVGKVIWADLATPDLATAERFYGGLFGWTFHETHRDGLDYAIAFNGESAIAGIFQRPPTAGESRQPAWLPFIAVTDVDVARRQALRNGGTVLSQPVSYPRRGRQSVLRDPQGAAFGVLASTSGDPPDLLAEPGAWIWSSLLTHDVDHATAFYQKLFGYEVDDLASTDGLEHVVLSTDNTARAGARDLPATASLAHPHWLNFIRVADTVATAAQVASLGGKVLVAPHPDRHGGQVAVFADPAGAPFAVMEWTETDSTATPKSADVVP